MLRYAFRRVLWVFPSVIGVSLVVFFVLSLLPGRPEQLDASPRDLRHLRREAWLDLPLFFNVSPDDARTLTLKAVADVAGSDPAAIERGADELARLGGVALPYVLGKLDAHDPAERARIALALAPVAERMGLRTDGHHRDPREVVAFWSGFWKSRGIELRATAAHNAVVRYARYGTTARARELLLLDTFALGALIEALAPPRTDAGVLAVRRLVAVISHITGRDDRLDEHASAEEAALCIERWQAWWLVYGTDYTTLTGAARVGAFVVETRYGKWVLRALVLELGRNADGQPVLDDLRERMQRTLGMVALAIALAYLLAIPLGALSAWRARGHLDRAVATLVMVPYVLSPAVLATLALWLGWPESTPMLTATLILAAVLVADPTRQQRAELLPVLRTDYVRAAAARGAGALRVVLVHGLRNALLPLVTRAALELPGALTAAFVLEHALGLSGLGQATLEAVASHDVDWLMALAVLAAVWAVIALVATDVAAAIVDPRLRRALSSQRSA